MTTFTRTLNITSTSSGSPTTITQNVAPGDQINVTVNGPNGDDIFADADTNCSSSQGGAYSSGSVVALTSFSGSSYTYTMTTTNGSKNNPVFHYGRVTGTISSASDTEVDSLSFGANVTGANLGAITYRSDQITGINQAVTFSKTSGASGFEWQVTSSATTPTSGWGTSSVSVSNNQYVHLKMTASSSYSTARSATFSIGSPAKTDTISTTTKAASSPSAFNLGDTASTTAGSSYNSNTITLAGLDTGQSVTVSISSNSSTYGYYKNGTLVASAANTTGANGDQFYVSHVANTGNGTVTSTSLTAGGTSDTFTTTNSGSGGGTGWFVSKGSPSGTPNEGDLIGMSINAPLGQNENFWWSVSPTDVNASTGSGTTSYNTATKGVPAYNIGGFNFTPNVDYTDDAAAGTGPYNYTVNVYDNSARTSLVATTIVAVNDTSQPLPPDAAINAIGNQTFAYAAGSNNGHSITIGGSDGNHNYYDVVVNGTTTPVYGTEIGNGTLEVADDNIAPGNQTTFRVYARRPTANNGDNSYYDTSRTYTVSRKAQTPSISAALASNPNDDDVTINWTISNGDGGTLQYSTDNVNWTNGSSFAQASKRGTAYTLYARTNATVVSDTASGSFTPGYNAPDAAISAIASPDLAYGSTTHVVAIAGGSSIDQYYVYNNAGSVSYGGRTGNGNITITHGVAAGGAATFRVYARRPVAVGGDNAFDDTGTTFEVEVYPNNVVLSVSNNNPSAASVTATLSVTGGQGGTIQYAKTSYSATTTYAQTRGTTVTYYARSVGSNGLISQVSFVDHSVGYIAPDAAITAIASPDLAYGSTTHAVAIAGGNASDQYFVYNNTGTVNYGSRTGNGNITITHGVAAGGAATFRVYVRRPLAVGGDNAFDDTGTTFEVEVYPQTPTASVAFNNPNDNDVTATVTASNTTGAASLAYSNGGTYVAGNTFAAVRGTAANYFVQSTGANGLTASGGTSGTPAYNAPDAAISAIASPDLAYGSTTHVVAIAGGSSIDQYYVYNNAGSVSYGGRTGNGNITITHGVAAGGAATFRVYARRPVAVGGDNAFDDTGTTFEVEVYPNNVVLSVSNNNPELANVTATLSATGGQGGTIEYAKTSYSATTTYAQARGTTVTYYARSRGSNGLISQVDSVNHTVGYIAPATYTSLDFTVPYNSTSHFDLLTSLPANDNYEVLTGGYTGTVRGSQSGGGGSLSVIEVTTINNPGENVTYYIRGYRATSVGGDGLYDNMDTYVVGELPQASTVLETFTDQGTESTSGTFRVKVTPGVGASSVQISLTNSSTNLQNNDTNLANVVRAGDRIFTRTTAANGTVEVGFLDTPATYLAPNTGSIAGTSSTIGPTATTGSTTVSGVLSGHTYVVKKNDGDNDKPRSAIFTANGALTISDNGVASPPGLPLLGQEFFYEFLVYRNTAAGGAGAPAVDDDWVETNRQFSIKRAPDAPTNILTSVPATQSATTSVILTAIGGTTGGTLQVSDDNVSWFANGSEFQNKTRGTSYTFYARRLGTNSVPSDLYTHPAYEIPYIGPDPSVTATNDTIAFNDTTASTTVGDINTNNNYAVRLNNGSTNLGIVDSSVTSPAVITFSSSLPTIGNTTTYEIFAARREDTGGSGIYVATNDTFTVTRLVEPVTIPTDLVMSTAATASSTPLVTATASGGSGGTLQVSHDNVNWYTNGSTFTRTRGTAYTFYARRVGSGSVTASYSEGYTPPYLFPDNTITVSPSTQQYTGVGSFNISVSDITADLGNNYQVRDSSGTIHENGTPAAGQTQVTISVSDEPNANPETYKIFSMRLVTTGGSGLYSDSGKTFTVSTSGSTGGITPPTIASVTDNAAVGSTVTTTINLSSTGQGGTLKYARNQSATPPATGWQTSSSFTNVPKNTVFYYHASQDEDTAGAFASPVQYAATDAAYGVLIKNSNNQSILDTRVDRQSTAIATGTLTVPVQTATVVSSRRYRIAITDPSGSGNTFGSFGAPNENSGTIFQATSSGTLGGSRRVGELISTGTNSIPGMTSANTDVVGILFTDEPVTGAASIPAYEINRLSGEFEISSKFSDLGNSTYTYKYIAVRY